MYLDSNQKALEKYFELCRIKLKIEESSAAEDWKRAKKVWYSGEKLDIIKFVLPFYWIPMEICGLILQSNSYVCTIGHQWTMEAASKPKSPI